MKILICGSRHWTNYNSILSVIRRLITCYGPDILIVEGGASGADLLSRKAAIECGISYKEFPADWNKYGRAAGPIRNQQMLEEVMEDEGRGMIIAFHEDLAKSKGTKDMVNRAKGKGIPIYIIKE